MSTPALAAAAKQKQLRELMAKAKAGGATAAPAARITDRLAKYDASGQLSCAICKTAVQPAAWTAHTQGKQHQQVRSTHRHACTAHLALVLSSLFLAQDRTGPPSTSPLSRVASVRAPILFGLARDENNWNFFGGEMMYTL